MVWPVANVSGSTTSITWDTASVKDNVLFMGFYTLNIYDAKTGKRGVATSGHLISSSDLRFGLYVPGANIPQTDEKYCATCRFIGSANGRVSDLDRLKRTVPWLIGAVVLALLY
ncbi:hypothetical protein BGX26_004656 [Mortierella sp. AD094]|nr:hypothetical protein BGX26_004656 [Mortierella sp. AD094]